jgi:hypothetical protein
LAVHRNVGSVVRQFGFTGSDGDVVGLGGTGSSSGGSSGDQHELAHFNFLYVIYVSSYLHT